MTTENLSLFKAIGARMEYLSQRQRVIAQNIANSDTPGYRPQDLTKVDFGQELKNIIGKNNSVSVATSNPKHVAGLNAVENAKEQKQKKTYEVAPAGNAVIMEEQLLNSNNTSSSYNLMTALYQKNIRLLKTSIGAQ
jgi:flagellar basal-body rod protein FlgB